jgi:lipopolysaccharide biosynthesis glycosyltransferase
MIDIIFSCDKNAMIGVKPLIHSILQNTQTQVKFHLLTNDVVAAQNLDCPHLHIKEFFVPEFLKLNVRVARNRPDYVKRVKNFMNYARFYFATMFPELDKVIYMDTDMICLGDIKELFMMMDWEHYIFGACMLDDPKWAGFPMNCDLIDHSEDNFNAGLFITSLEAWRREGIEQQFQDWMIKHKESKDGLFTYGTQPLMNLVFYKKFCKFPIKWNYYKIGYYNYDDEYVKSLKLLHYAGGKKPWDHRSGCKNTKWWNLYYSKN